MMTTNTNTTNTRYDNILLICTIILSIFGIVMLYSSSAIIAVERYNDSYHFLKKQIPCFIIGLLLLWVFMKIDISYLKRLAFPILAMSLVFLIMIFIPGFGREVNNAKRWLVLLGIVFQPSELAKLGMVMYTAHSLAKKADYMDSFLKGLLPTILLLYIISSLIMTQPDMGTTFFIIIVVMTMLFIGGAKISHMLSMSLIALILFIIAILDGGYRWRRILAYLNPWDDPTNTGYHLIQSFSAMAKGHILGVGLGGSKLKLFYLPEPHTDFIFSIIGEELGFVGSVITISLFFLLIWRGFKITINTEELYNKYLAFGITMYIGLQAVINIGVVIGLFPTKGLPLPLISLGGSSIIVVLMSIGILLNISRHADMS